MTIALVAPATSAAAHTDPLVPPAPVIPSPPAPPSLPRLDVTELAPYAAVWAAGRAATACEPVFCDTTASSTLAGPVAGEYSSPAGTAYVTPHCATGVHGGWDDCVIELAATGPAVGGCLGSGATGTVRLVAGDREPVLVPVTLVSGEAGSLVSGSATTSSWHAVVIGRAESTCGGTGDWSGTFVLSPATVTPPCVACADLAAYAGALGEWAAAAPGFVGDPVILVEDYRRALWRHFCHECSDVPQWVPAFVDIWVERLLGR